MIAVDTNVLVYAHRREPREHAVAQALLGRLVAARDAWGIPWPCVYEFFSVVTNPRIWKQAATRPERAWEQVADWCGAPNVRLLGETEGFTTVVSGLVCRDRVRGPVVHDARVAAICLAHGVNRLLTRDRDFALFPELVTENPF